MPSMDLIGTGLRLEYRPSSASQPQTGSSFWDERTLVTREKPQYLKMQDKIERDAPTPPRPSSRSKKEIEKFNCLYPGCERMFINQAELLNHIAVLHQSDLDDFDDPNSPEHPNRTESLGPRDHHHRDDDQDDAHSSAAGYGDQTIRPVMITEAALQALSSDREQERELARSMGEMSLSSSHRYPSALSSMDSVVTTHSVLDVYEDPVSEVGDPDDPPIKLPVQILLSLWRRFVTNFSARSRSNYRQNAPYPDSHQQPTRGSRSKGKSVAPPSQSSQSSSLHSGSRKRCWGSDGDEDEDHSEGPNKKRPQNELEHKPLACPFNKYDSYIFGGDATNSAYHVCSTWNDVKTAYFKQHLLRNHCIPEFHCDRCGGDFKNATTLREHRRSDPPCPIKPLDNQKILPEVQAELGLRTRNAVATSRVVYWYKVFDTIFGSEVRKKKRVEPYYEGPSHEVLERFLHFSELRMPEVIRSSRQKLKLEPEDYNDQNSELVRTILQEASHKFMKELRETQPQSLKEIKQENSPSDSAADPGEQTMIPRDYISSMKQDPATNERETIHQPWHPPTPGLQSLLPTEIASQSPYPRQFAPQPQQTFDLPTRPAALASSQQQMPSYSYDDAPDFSYTPYVLQDFENVQFIHDPEFTAIVEDPELYNPNSLGSHDLDFEWIDGSSRRERHLS